MNLSTGDIWNTPTEDYTELFLGGRGIAAKIYWDEVAPQTHAFDPDNRLIFITGPIGGVPGFAGSRWQVCGKSPIHNQFSYCNLGGSWGAHLKFAGYDSIVVSGKSDKLVYLHIDDDQVEISDADHLSGKGAIDCRDELKKYLGQSFRVVAIGPAGENRVVFANLVADNDATGSNGLGAVMGSKSLKAIAVRGTKTKIDIANPENVQKLRERVRLETESVPNPYAITMPLLANPDKLKKDMCYGCIAGCMRRTYEGPSGRRGKFMCHSSIVYLYRAQRYYMSVTDVPFEATKLCDDYGVDTHVIETMIRWLSRCYQAQVLTDEQTGIPLSKMGSDEFIETLLRKISHREGFGNILADGTHKAAETLGSEAQKLITDYMTISGHNPVYGPRLYITTALFYATEPRLATQQLHEVTTLVISWALHAMGLQSMISETTRDVGKHAPLGQFQEDIYITSNVIRAIAKRFWGSEIAADFSTYEGKALAAAKIQERQYAKESLILCDFCWPIMHTGLSEDHVGDPTLESQVCAAVTGRDVDEQGLYKIGERIFNLQRAILTREGHKGREFDSLEDLHFNAPLKDEFANSSCLVPGKDGEMLSRKGMVVERDQFEKMKDEYYQIRGWDVSSGFQTRAKLEELNLGEVADTLQNEGLLAQSPE